MSRFYKAAVEPETLDASVEAVLIALRTPESSGLRPEQLQAMFAGIVTAFAKYREQDKELSTFPKNCDVSATDVAIAATGILDAADVAVFELGMWQTLKQ